MLWIVHIDNYFDVSFAIFGLHDQSVILKLCLCVLILCHALKIVKFMDDQRSKKIGTESEGLSNPSSRGGLGNATGSNQNPRNERNNHVATTIDSLA